MTFMYQERSMKKSWIWRIMENKHPASKKMRWQLEFFQTVLMIIRITRHASRRIYVLLTSQMCFVFLFHNSTYWCVICNDLIILMILNLMIDVMTFYVSIIFLKKKENCVNTVSTGTIIKMWSKFKIKVISSEILDIISEIFLYLS